MERWTNSIKLFSSCHYLNFIRMATRRGKLKLCLHSLTVSCCLFWRDNSTADVDFLLLFIIPFIQSRDLSRRLPLTSTSSKQRREHFFQSAKVIAIKKNTEKLVSDLFLHSSSFFFHFCTVRRVFSWGTTSFSFADDVRCCCWMMVSKWVRKN